MKTQNPKIILDLLKKRDQARKEKKFALADKLRRELDKKGYSVTDNPDNTSEIVLKSEVAEKGQRISKQPGLIALFGSGEASPTGRRVHEFLIKDKKPPVKIALLETPAGFEENPRHWYGNLAKMMSEGLVPFKPEIYFVEALKNDGIKSTNNKKIVQKLKEVDYIHLGAGSPTYCVTNLKNSLAYQYLCEKNNSGTPLSFASAAAIALGEFCLPVYEIYKAGQDLHWEKGLNFFSSWQLNLTIVPHWNNTEGAQDVDTSGCFMGKKRLDKLLNMLPKQTCILGIDEQTAGVFNPNNKTVTVLGNGGITIIKNGQSKTFSSGSVLPFLELQ